MSPFEGPPGNNFDKDGAGGFQGRMYARFKGHAFDLVREIPVSGLLDVGCGDGRFIKQLIEANPEMHATGVDDGHPVLRAGWDAHGHPRLKFCAADVYALPFKAGEFELVTAFEVLEHLADPDAALQEIRRVCNGGWLVATVPWEPVWRAGNIAKRRYLRAGGNTPGHVQHWTRRGFRRFLSRHGEIMVFRGSTMWTVAQVRLARI